MSTANDVLVVGAGPVGLTAACALVREGASVRVIDTLEQPTTESRAVCIQPRSLEMLASLGVLPGLEELGRHIPDLAFLDGATGTARAGLPLSDVPSRHPYVLDIAQPDTESVLAKRATELGIVVERGTTLTGLNQDNDGVDAVLSTGGVDETARFGWVVGADGGHSSSRDLVGTKLVGGFQGQHFAMADVDIDTTWAPDAIRMFLHPDGMAILFPLLGERARLVFLVGDPGAGAELTLEQIQDLADERMGGGVKARNPRWLAYFEVHHAQIPQYRFGRVLLAGDAAHIHSPAGAQGMNTGMQDAANLAWKLALVAGGRAGEALLDSYDAERHPVGAAVVKSTTTLTGLGTAHGAKAAIRDLALFLVGHVSELAETGAATMAETAIAYRHSALSVHHGARPSGAARAGDHAPDPDGVLHPDGTPATMEELLSRPGMLLLVRTAWTAATDGLRGALGELGTVVRIVDEPDDGTGECVVDRDGALVRAYGLGREGLALIRPDGYIGLIADSADAEPLRGYLADTINVVSA